MKRLAFDKQSALSVVQLFSDSAVWGVQDVMHIWSRSFLGLTLAVRGSGGGAMFKPQPCSTKSILRSGANLRYRGLPSW